jgi:Uma2 family endonuclease
MLSKVLKRPSSTQVIMTPTALELTSLTDDQSALNAAFLEAGITLPPTQHDLPCSDGNKMETYRHKLQMDLLIETLQPWIRARSDGFVSGDMFVYYSLEQVKNKDFKGPDFYAVLGVPKGERLSWVCWEEGKSPDVVIELLSPSTAKYDKTKKKDIYQNAMKVGEYYWYDPFDSDDFKGFQIQNGRYQELQPDTQGNLPSHALGLQLVRWEGEYYDVAATWLRWAYPDGTLIPNREELCIVAEANADAAQANATQAQADAAQAQANAAQAQANAAQAQEQVQQIVNNLRSSGMDAAQIAIVTGLPIEQIQAFRI